MQILAGLASKGVDAADMGLATTPACFMSTIVFGHQYSGSLMCTASHLPWNRNGALLRSPAPTALGCTRVDKAGAASSETPGSAEISFALGLRERYALSWTGVTAAC